MIGLKAFLKKKGESTYILTCPKKHINVKKGLYMTFHRYLSLNLIALTFPITVPLCSMEPQHTSSQDDSSDDNKQEEHNNEAQTQCLTPSNPVNPNPEERSWKITRFWNSLYDPTVVALAHCNSNKNPKPMTYITQRIHDLEWGIENAIGQAESVRKRNDLKNIDSLLKVLRTNNEHSKNIDTIIAFSEKTGLPLNEKVLTNAYGHFSREDQLEKAHGRLTLEESQKRLEARKAYRRRVYFVKNVKDDIGYISDHEYEISSIPKHFLNHNTTTK